MQLPAGAAGICSAAVIAAGIAFAAGAQPARHTCGATSGATESATVLLLIEDVEDAPNTVLFEATRQIANKLSPSDVLGVDLGNESKTLDIPPHSASDQSFFQQQIARFEKQGIGDPSSYDDALAAAAKALAQVSGPKQVIILGDGDADPPSSATMRRLALEGVTVSSIFEKNSGPGDPAIMRAIASQGNGTFQNVGSAKQAAHALVTAVC